MSKYIIRNCPSFYRDFCDDTDYFCWDETDCVLKQIVELCKNIDCPCEYQGADCWECSEIGAKTFADSIIKLLKIEECEK